MVVKIEVMQIKERCFTETFLFKFKFFILKLWEFAHLFAATAKAFSFCCAIYGKNVQIESTQEDSPRAYICCRIEID